jgi:hypothetical protein
MEEHLGINFDSIQRRLSTSYNIFLFIDTIFKRLHNNNPLKFRIRDYHRLLIDTFEEKEVVGIVKSRQCGFSTILALYIAYKLIHETINIELITPSYTQSTNMLDRINFFMKVFRKTPDFYKTGKKVTFKKSKINAVNADSCLKSSVDLVIIDEFSFIKDQNMFLTKAEKKKPDVIFGGTPIKKGDSFYNFIHTLKKYDDEAVININWKQTHIYDKFSKQEIINQIGSQDQFEREYENNFI